MIQVITVDDRERTPNFGKPVFNASTVLVTPPVTVYAIRAYGSREGREFVIDDVFADNLSEEVKKRIGYSISGSVASARLEMLSQKVSQIARLSALVGVVPNDIGLSTARPQAQEIAVVGGDIKSQFAYLKGVLGKQVKSSDVLKPGLYVDAIGITKGKGFEGPITRFGVKRKQHKSRKSVRAVGVIGPWHPNTVMYTVARAGQMGLHERVMRNNRIIALANASQAPISPKGGFLHFGDVKGDYAIVRGSIPGPAKRLIDLRLALFPRKQRVQAPKIIEINVAGRAVKAPVPVIGAVSQSSRTGAEK
jgi:large subunit ribosomal protein L3